MASESLLMLYVLMASTPIVASSSKAAEILQMLWDYQAYT